MDQGRLTNSRRFGNEILVRRGAGRDGDGGAERAAQVELGDMTATRVRPGAGVEPAKFRDAMSRAAAAVHIVTTDGAFGKCGFTATAVCSVTDDPPTVLICLNQASGMHAAFEGNGVFCVNTLNAGQQDLAERFGGRGPVAMEDRFADPRWQPGSLGAPVLDGAIARLECEVFMVNEVGTHWVIFGRVVAVQSQGGEAALAYFDREYRRLPAAGENG